MKKEKKTRRMKANISNQKNTGSTYQAMQYAII